MAETVSLASKIIEAINDGMAVMELPRSTHEGYALLKERVEAAKKATADCDRLLKSLWDGCLEHNKDVVRAYAQELAGAGRNAAACYAALAAMANLTEAIC